MIVAVAEPVFVVVPILAFNIRIIILKEIDYSANDII
jgi:hypothetical protein